jgi:hypothetical protein
MLKIGCAGFPVGRDRYWRTLSFVEARTGEAMPQLATLEGWRGGAPADAEFSVQAYRLITHGPQDRGFPPAGKKLTRARQGACGAFRETIEVHGAWQATKAAAEALGARVVVFETPASFQPGPDRLRDLYRFFKTLPRGRFSYVWHPRSSEWTLSLLGKVCGELGLSRAFDPLRESGPSTGLRYLRPLGPRTGPLPVDKMSTLRSVDEKGTAYLALSHRAGFEDAEKLAGVRR